jgi:hypothetical protein
MRRIQAGHCPVQVPAIAFGAAALALFGLAAAATWGGLDPGAQAIESAAGALAGVAALTCWARRSARESDRQWRALADAARQDRSLLIRTLAAVAPPRRRELARTVPFGLVRGLAAPRRRR